MHIHYTYKQDSLEIDGFQKLKQEINAVCRMTYDYSDYGESILGQCRPQNRVGRRSCTGGFEDLKKTLGLVSQLLMRLNILFDKTV